VPCALIPGTTPAADFSGKTGAKVQLAVQGTLGQAIIIAAHYDGKALSAPWSFQIQNGIAFLTLLIENSTPRDWTTIQEVCSPGNSNTLLRYRFDPYGPSQSFEIQGT